MTFEQHIENIKNIPLFQCYNITKWTSYSATIEYWIEGTKNIKNFLDNGNDNWIETE